MNRCGVSGRVVADRATRSQPTDQLPGPPVSNDSASQPASSIHRRMVGVSSGSRRDRGSAGVEGVVRVVVGPVPPRPVVVARQPSQLCTTSGFAPTHAAAASAALIPSDSTMAAISFCCSVVSWNADRKSNAAAFFACSPADAAL